MFFFKDLFKAHTYFIFKNTPYHILTFKKKIKLNLMIIKGLLCVRFEALMEDETAVTLIIRNSGKMTQKSFHCALPCRTK